MDAVAHSGAGASCWVAGGAPLSTTDGSGGRARFGSVTTQAMYRKNNPYDFRVVPDDGEELPSVSNLERSVDEADEQR